MSALKVARLGNPVLRKVAQPVDLGALTVPGGEIQALIDDMIETMRQEGGVGLAAPQVSQSLQIVVVECEGNKRYPDRPDVPLKILVNPVIACYSKEQSCGWESCLSLIDFRGLVPRSDKISVEAYDRFGEKLVFDAEGFFAVALQHEIDHLNGIVFIDRMPDLTKLAYQEEFQTFWVKDEREMAEV